MDFWIPPHFLILEVPIWVLECHALPLQYRFGDLCFEMKRRSEAKTSHKHKSFLGNLPKIRPPDPLDPEMFGVRPLGCPQNYINVRSVVTWRYKENTPNIEKVRGKTSTPEAAQEHLRCIFLMAFPASRWGQK